MTSKNPLRAGIRPRPGQQQMQQQMLALRRIIAPGIYDRPGPSQAKIARWQQATDEARSRRLSAKFRRGIVFDRIRPGLGVPRPRSRGGGARSPQGMRGMQTYAGV